MDLVRCRHTDPTERSSNLRERATHHETLKSRQGPKLTSSEQSSFQKFKTTESKVDNENVMERWDDSVNDNTTTPTPWQAVRTVKDREEELISKAANFDTNLENIIEQFMPTTRRIVLDQSIGTSLDDLDETQERQIVEQNFQSWSLGSATFQTDTSQKGTGSDLADVQDEPDLDRLASDTDAADPAFNLPLIRTAALEALRNLRGYVNPRKDHVSHQDAQQRVFKIFETFEQEILPLVDLLHSSSSPQSFPRPSLHQLKVSDIHPDDLPTCLQNLRKSDVHVLPLITTLYPAATLYVLRHLASQHPSSQAMLALLPRIKEHGPTSYLLAGNIHFLNTLARVLWRVYNDVSGAVELLWPSTQNGTGVNNETISLLTSIIMARERDQVADGATRIGRSMLWWTLPVQQMAYKKIKFILSRPAFAKSGQLAGFDVTVDTRPISDKRKEINSMEQIPAFKRVVLG